MDNFSETSSQSWFSRLGGALKGIIVGLIFFIGAFFLLFWNEGRSVKRYKTLKEGSGAVVSVENATVNPTFENKLVHVTGLAKTDEVLEDSEFYVKVSGLKLKRKVEMYQWKERKNTKKKKKVGGGTKTKTTYSYSKVWSSNKINSTNFRKKTGHENPNSFPYSSLEKNASVVHLGDFKLTPSLVSKIGSFNNLPIIESEENKELLNKGFKFYNQGLYKGDNPSTPIIGDLRVNFSSVGNTNVSVVSKQVGDTFTPYTTKVGGEIELLENGIVSSQDMFGHAQQSNKILTWVLRFAGFLLMFIGLTMMFKIFSVLGDVIPILGSIVGAGVGFISFLIALVLTFLTISIAWITYRPILGISLIAVVVVLSILIKFKLKKA